MPLPASAQRTPVPIHMRDVKYRGYLRDDGMWDVEAELVDQKTYDIELHGERKVPAGKPIHHMWIRLTIDGDMVVHGIEAAMDDHPLGHCPEAVHPMQKMVGCCIARGWRRAIADNLGGAVGCTHLRELLFNMATPAFHTVLNQFKSNDSGEPPRHLGQCLGWDFNGPGVAKFYPEFKGWQPVTRHSKPSSETARSLYKSLASSYQI